MLVVFPSVMSEWKMKGSIWKGEFTLICGCHITNLSFCSLRFTLNTEIHNMSIWRQHVAMGLLELQTGCSSDSWRLEKPKQTNKIQTFFIMKNSKSQILLVHCSHFTSFLSHLYLLIFHLLFLYCKFSHLTALMFNFCKISNIVEIVSYLLLDLILKRIFEIQTNVGLMSVYCH